MYRFEEEENKDSQNSPCPGRRNFPVMKSGLNEAAEVAPVCKGCACHGACAGWESVLGQMLLQRACLPPRSGASRDFLAKKGKSLY